MLSQKEVEFEIIVVDNASQDDSLNVLGQFGDKIQLIKNSENLGFGKANNLAVNLSKGRYLFLLNPDALMLEPDDLKKIFLFIKNNKRFGLAGTRVLKANGVDESKPNYYYPGEHYIGRPYKDLPGKVAWVLGASMIIRKKVYNKINGFDEGFFLYGEDPDICLRIRKLGYEIGYFSDVSIKHIGGVSERGTDWYWLATKKQKALHLFYTKHYTPSAVKFLMRRDIRLARIKMLLGALRSIATLGLLKRKKDRKHRAIYDFCKEHL